MMAEDVELDIDLEAIFQEAFGPEGGNPTPGTVGGIRTDELTPGRVVWAPDKADPLGMRSTPRTVELAYHEELADPSRESGFTQGRWVVLFSDGEQPRGFQTTASRRWAVPAETDLVAAGVEWIDEHVPYQGWDRWWWRVDPDRLAMDSSCACLLAQLDDPEDGVFEDVAQWFFPDTPEGRSQLVGLGFYVHDESPEREMLGYRVLDHLWRAVIRDRRARDTDVVEG